MKQSKVKKGLTSLISEVQGRNLFWEIFETTLTYKVEAIQGGERASEAKVLRLAKKHSGTQMNFGQPNNGSVIYQTFEYLRNKRPLQPERENKRKGWRWL